MTDEITVDGQDGISFIHPSGEIFLLPLAGEPLLKAASGNTSRKAIKRRFSKAGEESFNMQFSAQTVKVKIQNRELETLDPVLMGAQSFKVCL